MVILKIRDARARTLVGANLVPPSPVFGVPCLDSHKPVRGKPATKRVFEGSEHPLAQPNQFFGELPGSGMCACLCLCLQLLVGVCVCVRVRVCVCVLYVYYIRIAHNPCVSVSLCACKCMGDITLTYSLLDFGSLLGSLFLFPPLSCFSHCFVCNTQLFFPLLRVQHTPISTRKPYPYRILYPLPPTTR